jgi:RNA polymerase sigma-70 factor (ECF subfamily)
VGTTCYAIETQAVQGDIAARHINLKRNAEFEAIALPNLAVLYRKALHMLRDASAAEDTVQETCLRAWQIFDQFTPGTNGRAWLFAILTNVVRHELRRSRRCRIDPRSREILETCAAATKASKNIFDHHLAAAIEGMRPQFREVLVMAVVSEMQYREIASRLQIPVGTVMSRLARARAHLRYALTRPTRTGCDGATFVCPIHSMDSRQRLPIGGYLRQIGSHF